MFRIRGIGAVSGLVLGLRHNAESDLLNFTLSNTNANCLPLPLSSGTMEPLLHPETGPFDRESLLTPCLCFLLPGTPLQVLKPRTGLLLAEDFQLLEDVEAGRVTPLLEALRDVEWPALQPDDLPR